MNKQNLGIFLGTLNILFGFFYIMVGTAFLSSNLILLSINYLFGIVLIGLGYIVLKISGDLNDEY